MNDLNRGVIYIYDRASLLAVSEVDAGHCKIEPLASHILVLVLVYKYTALSQISLITRSKTSRAIKNTNYQNTINYHRVSLRCSNYPHRRQHELRNLGSTEVLQTLPRGRVRSADFISVSFRGNLHHAARLVGDDLQRRHWSKSRGVPQSVIRSVSSLSYIFEVCVMAAVFYQEILFPVGPRDAAQSTCRKHGCQRAVT